MDTLNLFHNMLNKDDPCKAAIFACLMVLFYCLARLSKFTVPSIKNFNPSKHITWAGYHPSHNHEGLPIMVFHPPTTKCSSRGKTVQCAPQPTANLDPQCALKNHFCLNPAGDMAHLFA
ncbi:hypothetical protein EDC04DRAFT_2896931 [Pisolithus marmoratus]|nr:hypothetical protein EDC04DRAFT_2896931 [Pisolithus marmoratus]